MDITTWLTVATDDAARRGVPGAVPLITALIKATETLRATAFQEPMRDERSSYPGTHGTPTHD